jgi:transcriptional regulator with XRE-family HTH domain
MVSGESPAVARRRVRLALREAREAKSLTQSQVSRALEWSLSKVNRIESGEVSISTTDLKALLEFYGVDDKARIDLLVEDARTSRRERWYTDPRYREHLTPATLHLLQFETEATAIRVFNVTIIPGILQTPLYARAILENRTSILSAEDMDIRHEVRMRRRELIFSQKGGPDYLLILDESVLHREVGGPAVMAEQLQELLALVKRLKIRVRVVPFAAAAPIAVLGPFTLLELGDESDTILYRETFWTDEIVHASRQVQAHREVFEELWSRSLSEPASARLVAAQAAAMISSLDRQS